MDISNRARWVILFTAAIALLAARFMVSTTSQIDDATSCHDMLARYYEDANGFRGNFGMYMQIMAATWEQAAPPGTPKPAETLDESLQYGMVQAAVNLCKTQPRSDMRTISKQVYDQLVAQRP